MDKELLRRLGIIKAAADLLKDQQATREALELMNPGSQAAREIARMQEAIDPMRQIRQSKLARYGDLQEALKRYEDQYLASPHREFAEIEKASRLAQVASHYTATQGYLPDSTLEAIECSSRFTAPTTSAIQAYLEIFEKERADLLKTTRATLLDGGVRDALAHMKSPWLDLHDITGSISGVVGLRELGQSLAAHQPYDIETSRSVRQALGDWRDFTTSPSRATSPATDREVLYRERGLEPALVRFPTNAFDELTDDAGLTAESNAVFALFDSDLPVIDVNQSALQRATFAFQRLLRFEIYLRRFIHDAMTKDFGEDWPRHRLPPNIYNDWMDKQSRAQAKGGDVGLLIDQADFTHYLTIIQRSDNWSTVFKPLFHRKEDVMESLQRLAPLRVHTMHARPMSITNADLLMLYVETTRIVRAVRLYAARLN